MGVARLLALEHAGQAHGGSRPPPAGLSITAGFLSYSLPDPQLYIMIVFVVVGGGGLFFFFFFFFYPRPGFEWGVFKKRGRGPE